MLVIAGRGRQRCRERKHEQRRQTAPHRSVASFARAATTTSRTPESAAAGLASHTVVVPQVTLPFRAPARPQFVLATTVCGQVRAGITPKGDSAAVPSIEGSGMRAVPILAPGARAARVPRAVPDPRGDDVPDQPLAGRDARRRRGARARVRAHLEHARRARLGGGLVGDVADRRRPDRPPDRRAARLGLDAPERDDRRGGRRSRASASTGRAGGSSTRRATSRRCATSTRPSAGADILVAADDGGRGRGDRRADAARPDHARALQDRRDPGRRGDRRQGARGRRATSCSTPTSRSARCRST